VRTGKDRLYQTVADGIANPVRFVFGAWLWLATQNMQDFLSEEERALLLAVDFCLFCEYVESHRRF